MGPKESTPEPMEPIPEPKEPTPEPKEPTPEPKESTPEPMEPTPEHKEPTPEPKKPSPDAEYKIKEPTPEPKEPTPPPRPSTPPPEEVQSILQCLFTMGCDCDESDPPPLTSIPVRKPTPQPSNDDGEETRSQRRARILAAQREAMWGDDESGEESEPEEEVSNSKNAESQGKIFSEDPDVEQRVAAITKRVDQLKALLVSCPEASRDFVNGHIVSLQTTIAVLKAASRAVQKCASRDL